MITSQLIDPSETLVKTGRAAREANVSAQTIHVWRRNGRLRPFIVTQDGTAVYRLGDVRAVADARKAARG